MFQFFSFFCLLLPVAISGVLLTQFPLCKTRCIEKRKIWAGKSSLRTMITEGIVALIWAAAARTFFAT